MRLTTIASSLFLLAFASLSSSAPSTYPNSYSSHWPNNNAGVGVQEAIQKDPKITLSDSKAIPVLHSGNLLITAHQSQILDTDNPNTPNPPHLPPSEVSVGSLDILRGKIQLGPSQKPGSNGVKLEVTTAVAFRVPHSAQGKLCSFHFFMGGGDFATKGEWAAIYSLDGSHNKPLEEFKTTWNTKPLRNHIVGEFQVGEGGETAKADTGDSSDAKFTLFQGGPILKVTYIESSKTPAFPCDSILGETQWEIVGLPKTPVDGKPQGVVGGWAWSMNKGLSIEVHGLKAESNPKSHGKSKTQAGNSRYKNRFSDKARYEWELTPEQIEALETASDVANSI